MMMMMMMMMVVMMMVVMMIVMINVFDIIYAFWGRRGPRQRSFG
jgi:ABC-type sugar transport system permease subunit